jgi:3-oxoacyl-[acyl-carrier protein] reductase
MEAKLMNYGLVGKTALVTGASNGIGKQIAIDLAMEGCNVVICSRNISSLNNVADEIRSHKVNCYCIAADLLETKSIEYVYAKALQNAKDIDILINNVGGGGRLGVENFHIYPESEWEKIYKINLSTAVRFTQLVLPNMMKKKWGRVLTIASIKGKEAGVNPWYTFSKGSEISLMKSLSLQKEYVRCGITFNSIAPGRVIFENNEWDLFEKENRQGFMKSVDEKVPLGRLGTPKEIGAVATFLCSNQASFVNGACFVVDGGESFSF